MPTLKLPISSADRDDVVIFEDAFTIPADAYVYFEVHSDFAMSDLVLYMRRVNTRKSSVIVEEQPISSFDRKHIKGLVNAGKYTL